MSSTTQDDVVAAYRRYAPIYDYVYGAVLEGGRRVMAARLREQPPRRLLEVGVGTGLLLPQYPSETSIVGIDISHEMLAKARERVRTMGRHDIELVHADAERLPFADASFDCVTLPYVLSVTPDPQALITELRRVCMPGGRIYIINHFANAQGWRWAERLVRPLAQWIGFDSNLDMDSTIGTQDWRVLEVRSVNLMGLSRLVVLHNAPA